MREVFISTYRAELRVCVYILNFFVFKYIVIVGYFVLNIVLILHFDVTYAILRFSLRLYNLKFRQNASIIHDYIF